MSAGAIIIREGKILLVRYNGRNNNSLLVGPGGGVENDEESITQALIREVKEETGLEVTPFKLLFVEDFLSSLNKTVKIWFLCDVVSGQVASTQGASDEGITEVGWYERDKLENEVVYPSALLDENWESFFTDNFEAKYLGFKIADF
ncbi:MAG: NUDIX domain-containing protein [Dehalococcoidales bacterium]